MMLGNIADLKLTVRQKKTFIPIAKNPASRIVQKNDRHVYESVKTCRSQVVYTEGCKNRASEREPGQRKKSAHVARSLPHEWLGSIRKRSAGSRLIQSLLSPLYCTLVSSQNAFAPSLFTPRICPSFTLGWSVYGVWERNSMHTVQRVVLNWVGADFEMLRLFSWWFGCNFN